MPVRTLGTDTDITRLKTIELELAAEKERLRVTLNSIADGMISTDETGRVVFMNPAAELLTGYAQRAGARPGGARHLRAARRRHRRAYRTVRSPSASPPTKPAHLDDDMILVGRSGIERDIRCTASPVRMPGGKLTGAVLVFQDVTQSRAMQRRAGPFGHP